VAVPDRVPAPKGIGRAAPLLRVSVFASRSIRPETARQQVCEGFDCVSRVV